MCIFYEHSIRILTVKKDCIVKFDINIEIINFANEWKLYLEKITDTKYHTFTRRNLYTVHLFRYTYTDWLSFTV